MATASLLLVSSDSAFTPRIQRKTTKTIQHLDSGKSLIDG